MGCCSSKTTTSSGETDQNSADYPEIQESDNVGATCTGSRVTANVCSTYVRSIEFVNSNAIFRRNARLFRSREGRRTNRSRSQRGRSDDILEVAWRVGDEYKKPEWQRDRQNAPASHTRGEEIRLKLEIRVSVDNGPHWGRVVGTPLDEEDHEVADPAFRFQSEEIELRDEVEVDVEAEAPLPDWPEERCRQIKWRFSTDSGTSVQLGESGPHTVFVTFGPVFERSRPHELMHEEMDEVATAVRMREAIERVNIARQELGSQENEDLVGVINKVAKKFPETICDKKDYEKVEKIVDKKRGLREYIEDVGWSHFTKKIIWPLASIEKCGIPGADCHAIARLIRAIFRQVGLEGVSLWYIVPDQPPTINIMPPPHDQRSGWFVDRSEMYHNHEAFLRYRYQENGTWYQAWYAAGVEEPLAGVWKESDVQVDGSNGRIFMRESVVKKILKKIFVEVYFQTENGGYEKDIDRIDWGDCPVYDRRERKE